MSTDSERDDVTIDIRLDAWTASGLGVSTEQLLNPDYLLHAFLDDLAGGLHTTRHFLAVSVNGGPWRALDDGLSHPEPERLSVPADAARRVLAKHRFSINPDDPEYVVVDWRIPEFLGGGTHCVPVDANGDANLEDVWEAISEEIGPDYIADCAVEVTRMGSGEPLRPLAGGAGMDAGLDSTAERLIDYLQRAFEEGLTLSDDQRGRLTLLLRGTA